MRKLVWTILLASVSVLSFAQHAKNGWQTAKLKGKVKEAGQVEYAPNDKGELVKQSGGLWASFNTSGYITQMELGQGEQLVKLKMEFDKNGFLSKMLSLDKEGKWIVRNVQENDSKGNVLIDKSISQDGMEGLKTHYTYDANGFLIESLVYRFGAWGNKTVYVNDKKGNPLEEVVYDDEKGTISYKILSKYDKRNNRTEAIAYDRDGGVMEHYTYKYDKHNNLVEEKSYKADKTIHYVKTYSYLYDKQKNWYKKTEYTNGKLSRVTDQSVKYY